MKADTQDILIEFDNCKQLYLDFIKKCSSLIIDLLNEDYIKYHQITYRLKEKMKLEDKIIKKEHKYSTLSDITDIAGIRIISYFEDEVERIANLITTEFEIDLINSIDKRKIDSDRFGYRSLHFVISLNKDRIKLPEYKKFKNLKLELQIRTILQHSWAEIEHDIGYKGEITIPQFAKRSFYRVAALLETADIEFVKLKETLKIYESEIASEIIKTPETVTLDKASLISFIHSNEKINKLNIEFSEHLNVPIRDTIETNATSLLTILKETKIYTIKDLDKFLETRGSELLKVFKMSHPSGNSSGVSGLSNGIVLYQIMKLDRL